MSIRADKAVEYKKSGMNCAQSVALAYSDLTDLDPETIAAMTQTFGMEIGASFSQMTKGIAPYINKSVFGNDTIDEDQIAPVAQLLLTKYNNIALSQGVYAGKKDKLWLKIRVSGKFGTKEKELTVLHKYGRKKHIIKASDWTDDLFEFWSMMED